MVCVVALASLSSSIGCASAPAAPFDTLKTAPVRAFRLQNYEPPAAPATTAAAPNVAGVIPGLPPEITKWVQAGMSALPPGLLPPGIIPGAGTAAGAAAPAASNVPRFEGFRILSQVDLVDDKLKAELVDVLGQPKSFDAGSSATCAQGIYAEFGFSFYRGATQPPADVLVSFSCNRVEGRNFVWPHPSSGMTPDTAERLVRVGKTVFGNGM